MVGGFVIYDQLSQSAQRLLDTGTQVTGTVYEDSQVGRGGWSIYIQYIVISNKYSFELFIGYA
jgi:hypothetical protein